MIVSCPACETRYLVDEAELGGEAGRRVRCASCGHLWRYSAEAAAIHLAVAAITAELTAAQAAGRPAAATQAASTAPPAPALRAEPGTQVVYPFPAAAAAPVRPAVTPMPYVPPQRTVRGGTWLAALAAVGALVIILVLGRDTIVALYPPIASLYRTLHMAAPTGAGLQLTSTVTREQESLTVAGEIVNNTREPQPLAHLRVTLRDGARHSLETRVIAPPMALLPPGLTAYYSTTFDRPSITVAGADVAFAAN